MKTKILSTTFVILIITVFAILKSAFLLQNEPTAGINQNQVIVREVTNNRSADHIGMEAAQVGDQEQTHSTLSMEDQAWMLRSAVEFRFKSCNSNDTIHLALGTKLDEQTVLTHNHHGNYTEICMVNPVEAQVSRDIPIKTTSQPMGHGDQYGDQTRLVYLTEQVAGSFAPIASQQGIDQLAAGEFVAVVYWDDAVQELAIAKLQIKGFLGNSVMVLDDPADIINEGDSGGGVYYQDTFVGNTWKYFQIQDLQGNQIDKEVHVQIIPPELDQAVRNWQQTRENMDNSSQPLDQDSGSCSPSDDNTELLGC